MNVPNRTYFVILAGAIVWCSALVAAPLLVSLSGSFAATGQLLYAFFHTVCHQLDDRSFHAFGEPLAVCSRCASIYFAFLAAVMFYPLRQHISDPAISPRVLLLAATAPMALDVAGGLLGIHEVTITTRTITGGFFGLLLPFIIIPVAVKAVQELQRPFALGVRHGSSDA